MKRNAATKFQMESMINIKRCAEVIIITNELMENHIKTLKCRSKVPLLYLKCAYGKHAYNVLLGA